MIDRRTNHIVPVSSVTISSITATATDIASISPTISSDSIIPSNRPQPFGSSISGDFGTKTTLGLPVNSIQLVFGPTTPTATATPTEDPTSESHFGPVAIALVALGVLLGLIGLLAIVLVLKVGKGRRRDALDFGNGSSNKPPFLDPASLCETPDELQAKKHHLRPSTSRRGSYFSNSHRVSSVISSPAQSFDIMRVSARYVLEPRRSTRITLTKDGHSFEPPYRLSSDTCMVLDPLMMQNLRDPPTPSKHLSFTSNEHPLPDITAHNSPVRHSNLPLPRPKPAILKNTSRDSHHSMPDMSLASGQTVFGISQDLPSPSSERSRDTRAQSKGVLIPSDFSTHYDSVVKPVKEKNSTC
ncbi:uncharacterized protein MELLADRAFT_58758 [Melampsora larici-populina 98AG31]|uniref:Uncharacterized protein n=1 Tax=Melampsora larici-populina (strain 98AG31 / pathotype 3-4-7) TaxID=747676 RepID=F4R4R1_MELLP|nr:uncharacterized protein MELLADRAFT_58758 [Melampsora larici-populina 98AG31]EGG12852.1 hypothetical protein MELLADRAFT_58758 [Melampsora larici-populina 98AG31]